MKAFKYLTFLVVLIYSCTPEELPPVQTGDPVFSVTGDHVNIIAGEDDFYLFSDYEKDDMDVYSFVSHFAKTGDCTSDCEEELLIKIRDIDQNTGAIDVDIENALSPGNYNYQIANSPISNDEVVLNLTAEPEGNGPFSYLWLITYSDTIFNSYTFTTETVDLPFSYNANVSLVNVCLTISDNNMCQIQDCKDISLNTNVVECQVDFTLGGGPAMLQLTAIMSNGVAPYTYLWSNGDTTDTISENIIGPFNAVYCVTITDAQGCADSICKQVNANQGSAPSICSAKFSYEKIFEPGTSDTLQLNTVFIQYTDETGKVYRSDLNEQPNSSNFIINTVEDYELNENGDKTKKLDVSANCRLFDTNGSWIEFPFQGIIAVAYP